MSYMYGKFDTAPVYYDFAVEGGAIGTINLGIVIPKFFIISKSILITYISPVSAGAATIAFGKRIGATDSVDFFAPAQAYTNFVETYPGNTMQGVDFNANPQMCSDEDDAYIIMTIAGATLTAGRIGLLLQTCQVDNLTV